MEAKIVELKVLPLSSLKAAEYNPRKELKPGDEEYEKIKRSLERFGFADPVVVNSDMTIIGGHQRVRVAKDIGMTEAPCSVVDLSKEDEKALNIALNKITGSWDNDKLAAILQGLSLGGYDTTLTGFTDKEQNELLNGLTLTKTAGEDGFDLDGAVEAIEEPWVKRGQVFQLGVHRLMCGDSTSEEDVDKLMNGNKADLIITDPPYNVDYHGGTGMTIENDNMDDSSFYHFLLDAFRNMSNCCREGASAYIFHADSEGLNFRKAFKDAGFKISECLIWAKQRFVLGRNDYHWRHEPCLYGWKEGASHYFVDDRTQDTILEFDRPEKNDKHPTMKPLPLVGKLMQNSSMINWKVLDLFGGSGSTLMAATQLDRQAFTMELDPKYCQVIIERWQEYTGEQAVLVDD